MKKVLSVLLAVVLILSAAPLSGVSEYLQGVNFGFLAVKSSAASTSDLTFKLNSDCKSYYVSDCKTSASGALTIPSTYNGKPVTRIGYEAFCYCTNLTSITIPDSVTSIDELAFSDCSNLKSITIPDSVTSIGRYAFGWCSNLTSITISGSITSIGYYAFSGCTSLSTITIPKSVTSIGRGAFSDCSSLTSVTIPDSVTSIGDDAFSNCSSLTSVTIPDSVTNIGDHAFGFIEDVIEDEYGDFISVNTLVPNFTIYSKPNTAAKVYADENGIKWVNSDTASESDLSFESNDDGKSYYVSGCNQEASGALIIPSTYNGKPVTRIGYEAFCYCTNLTSITIPDSVTSIDELAFSDCSSLKSITIPDSVRSIGEYAFGWCSNLTSITISGSVTSIGYYAFSGCTSLSTITIPKSVTSIGGGAFSDCSSLTSVTIPDSVTSIGDDAFSNCSSLTSVTIPDRVTSIGEYAFSCCSDSLVLYGFSGSTAESYASDNSITFKAVNILPKQFEKIDYANNCIFSEETISSLDECLIADKNIALECVKSSFGFIGTGTIVNVKSGDTVIDTYTMIVNGDLDGDGVSDVLDAVLAERAANGHGELSDAQAYAANNSADTEIDVESYQNVVNRALGA